MQTAAQAKPMEEPESGLEALFREHHAAVFRAAYRITGSVPDAEDALQTVFLRLLAREGQPAPESAGGYLRRAGVNAALDLLRARGEGGATPPQGLADPSPGPDRIHADREQKRRLRKELSSLSPLTAEAFALRYFEGYGNREVARLLGTSPAVIAVLLFRARARLKKAITIQLGDES